MDRPFYTEACVVSLEDALQAQHRGADRVEICDRLETEGMTPTLEMVSTLCAHLNIPVRVMIRSTEMGFEADTDHIRTMFDSIQQLKSFSIDGFVIGVIKNKRIDRDAMETLLASAHPLPVTFHKAIDQSFDIESDIEWINQFPQIDTILTSGGAVKAMDGAERILLMKSIFNGTIMAGGKITPGNLPGLHEMLGLKWYHGRSII